HPLIAGNLVLWADARYVNAHDLLTGRRVFRYDLLKDGIRNAKVLEHVSLKLPARPDLRYSLSVSGDRAFVRLGTQGLGPAIYQTINGKVVTVQGKPVVIPDESNSFLVCLSLKPGAKRREEWSASAKLLPLDAPQRFEGAPLVHDGRVYIVHSRFES